MSGMFRSEDMQFVRLTMTNEAAYATMLELGKLGKFHMEDMMADAGEPSELYTYYKKRAVACFNWERRLRRFEELMVQHNVEVPEPDLAAAEIAEEDILAGLRNFLDPLERELDQNLEYKFSEDRSLNELRERRIVLQQLKVQLFAPNAEVPEFAGQNKSISRGHELELDNMDGNDLSERLLSSGHISDDYDRRNRDEEKGAAARFHNYICGAIPLVQQGPFERMLFRMSRGNAFAKFFPLEEDVVDPQTGEPVKKAVFYVVYIGKQLQRRVTKMCEYFRGNVYPIPDVAEAFDMQVRQLAQNITDKEAVLVQTERAIQNILERVARENGAANDSPLRNWQEALRREKLVCDALKKCHTPNNRNLITAEGWVPNEDLNAMRQAVIDAVRFSGAQPALVQPLSTYKAPPTYFKTNKFTRTFQGIVDTYGVPRYKEVNPGLFTVVTFPFLFGVMYGDMGHSFVMFLFSIYVLYNEKYYEEQKKKKKMGEIFSMIFGGRYLILMMSMFAFYCGTIYNDLVSVPLNAFESRWYYPTVNSTEMVLYDVDRPPYPFGVDPAWYNTKNELTFFNSMKMKLSVTLGVTHMVFGIILSCLNHMYFKDNVSIFFEFIPQLVFMLCTFGYMIFLCVFKLCIDWEGRSMLPADDPLAHNPPNLIQTMINMFLSFGSVEQGKLLYHGQPTIQLLLVMAALFSVPMMLFPKPYILKYRHQQQLKAEAGHHLQDEESDMKEKPAVQEHGHGGHGEHGHFDFGELFIHQAIHTIEFVLGAVSNTASYLRLWALSLAHAELSNVFWNKLIMQYGVEMNAMFTFLTWGAWAGATVAVLLCMDSLECFLHALRLHWVEFQNKFYKADGYAFAPFNFEPEEDD